MDTRSAGKKEDVAKMPERDEKLAKEQDPLREGQRILAGQAGGVEETKPSAPVAEEPRHGEPHKKHHGKHRGSHRGEKQHEKHGEEHEEQHAGEHPHRAMTPLEDEVTYHGELGDIETMTEDPDWRRENLPSVPLEKKDPKHHDVVEEGLIPEALPELGSEEKTAA